MTKNIFAQAQAQTKPTSKKDSKHVVIEVPTLLNDIKKFNENKEKIDELTAELEMAKANIEAFGRTNFLELGKKSRKNPGSFILKASEGEQVMYIPMDKYKTIDKERFDTLSEKYSGDVVEEKTIFSIDPEMIEKYGQVLSDLITKCKAIDTDDKSRLIVATQKFNVKKGAIDQVFSNSNISKEMADDLGIITAIKRA